MRENQHVNWNKLQLPQYLRIQNMKFWFKDSFLSHLKAVEREQMEFFWLSAFITMTSISPKYPCGILPSSAKAGLFEEWSVRIDWNFPFFLISWNARQDLCVATFLSYMMIPSFLGFAYEIRKVPWKKICGLAGVTRIFSSFAWNWLALDRRSNYGSEAWHYWPIYH